jgi:hypothetical protein
MRMWMKMRKVRGGGIGLEKMWMIRRKGTPTPYHTCHSSTSSFIHTHHD